MLVGVSCGLLATLSFHLIVREAAAGDTEEAGHQQQGGGAAPGTGVWRWLLNPSLYFVACVYMATRLYVNLTQAYIPFYLQVTRIYSIGFKTILTPD